MKTVSRAIFTLSSSLLIMPVALKAMDNAQAEAQVKAAMCLNGQTIESVLQQKITSINRDLGWQVFNEDNHYVVERGVLVSKGMQLRYRWQIDEHGVQPASDRAKTLCEAASDSG